MRGKGTKEEEEANKKKKEVPESRSSWEEVDDGARKKVHDVLRGRVQVPDPKLAA